MPSVGLNGESGEAAHEYGSGEEPEAGQRGDDAPEIGPCTGDGDADLRRPAPGEANASAAAWEALA